MSTLKNCAQKSAADLQKELLGLRREQFNLRMARATGQAAKPDQFTKVRRNIARLKTVHGRTARARATPRSAREPRALPPKLLRRRSLAPKKAGAKKQE